MPPRRVTDVFRLALPWLPMWIGAAAASAQDIALQEVEYLPLEALAVEDDAAERIDDRLGEPEWLPPRESAPEPAKSGWDLGLALEIAYDDNIFLSSARPESDVVTTVTPKVGFVAGRDDGEGAYLSVAYRPSAVIYLENSDETRVDHRLAVGAGSNGRRWGLRFGGELARLGGATSEVGAPIDRTEYAAELRAAWRPREKFAIELAAGLRGADYDDRRFSDSESRYLEAALRYAYSPKTEVTLAVAGGAAEVGGAPDQDFLRTTGRLVWKPREKLTLDLVAGFEHRDYAVGSDTFPVVEGRVEWTPVEGTELYVTGYLREESSAFFPGENIEVAGVGAGVSRRLGGGWTARLEGGYESADYKRVAAIGAGGRRDEIFFLRPSVEYEVTDHFRLGAFYRYERNDSNNPGFGYTVNRLGVDAAYDF